MILKIYRAYKASSLYEKAVMEVSSGNDDEAFNLLKKCKEVLKGSTYSILLLEGFLHSEKNNWIDAIEISKKAKIKIANSKRLNIDEKIYLTAYANDTINYSIVKMNSEEPLLPVDVSFDIKKVDSVHKKVFKIKPR